MEYYKLPCFHEIQQYFGGRNVLKYIFLLRRQSNASFVRDIEILALSQSYRRHFSLQVAGIAILSFAKYNSVFKNICGKFYFIIKSRDSLVLRGITLKFATRTNNSVNVALHGCQGKVSLFMLAALIGFVGKIAHLKRKEGPKKGHYFAFFHWKT